MSTQVPRWLVVTTTITMILNIGALLVLVVGGLNWTAEVSSSLRLTKSILQEHQKNIEEQAKRLRTIEDRHIGEDAVKGPNIIR